MNYDMYSSKEKEREGARSIVFEFTENFYDDPAGELLKKSERRTFNLRP